MNDLGQLGAGSFDNEYSPIFVLDKVVAIAAGYYHSLFLGEDGLVRAAGKNHLGQLGDLSKFDRSYPVIVREIREVKSISAGYYHSLFLKHNGHAYACGMNSQGQLGDGTTDFRLKVTHVLDEVEDIAAGAYHSLFVRIDGAVWHTGRPISGLKPNQGPEAAVRTKPARVMPTSQMEAEAATAVYGAVGGRGGLMVAFSLLLLGSRPV
eukprot:gnl/TRDRNA2_/TRDRNA2_134975_c1_seq1.p1 gnl/TRDRNA2_/TRDRNA2_134975_c1~~gnl/TRDRNA2_/TRDRNA2_134975_c1_seq1.p1  ORF type:complete len:215 (-),score=27.87 gnl/TRDRNA2_/TRDRNA2_134975_c1_seq1:57-680(-)